MLAGKFNQVGPAMINDSILWFQPGQVPVLQKCGDNGTTWKAGLGIIWLKLSHTQNMTQALVMAIWGNLDKAPLAVTNRSGNTRHPAMKRLVMNANDPEEL